MLSKNESLIKKYKDDLIQLKDGIIPESFPDTENYFGADMIEILKFREEYVTNYTFPLICKSWIKPLAKFIDDDKCLEIMGGTGILSYALRKEGVNILCTDNLTWENYCSKEWKDNHYFDIKKLNAVDAIEKYGKDVNYIIMSWAPYSDDIAVEAYRKMKEINPECLMLYIGEEYGGCTASDEFFNESINSLDALYDEESDNKFSKDILEITEELNEKFPSFTGIHDRIFFVK